MTGLTGGSVTEGQKIIYTLSLNTPAHEATDNLGNTPVDLSFGGNAIAGSDYVAGGEVSYDEGMSWQAIISSRLSVPAGKANALIRITSLDNLIHESDRSLNLSASTVSSNIAATGTITDNDLAPKVISVSSPSITEGGKAVFNIGLSNLSTTPTTVNLTMMGATAISGIDFTTAMEASFNGSSWLTVVNNSVSVPAMVGSFRVRVATVDDVLYEQSETFTLNATANSGSAIGVATIADNDLAPVVATVSNSSISEGGYSTFIVYLSGASFTLTTIDLALAPGTAVAADYSPNLEYYTGTQWVAVSNNRVTIAPGDTSIQIRNLTVDDGLYESSETYTFTATANMGAATGTATITDNDIRPNIASVSNSSVTEGGYSLFTVSLSSAPTAPISVNLALAGSTATSGADFANSMEASFNSGSTWATISGGIVTVSAGVSNFQVRVQTIDDTAIESTETYSLIASTNGGSITGTGTIVDNDAPVSNDGGSGTTDPNVITGTTGNDLIQGGGGDRQLYGNSGNDTIYAGSQANPDSTGDPILFGDSGNDTLYAGSVGSNYLNGANDTSLGIGEQDILVGGNLQTQSSYDVFVVGNLPNTYYVGNGNNDFVTINNFDPTQDIIRLGGSVTDFDNNYLINNSTPEISKIYWIAGGLNDLVAVVNTTIGLTSDNFYFESSDSSPS